MFLPVLEGVCLRLESFQAIHVYLRGLDIQRDVDPDRSRASGPRKVNRLLKMPRIVSGCMTVTAYFVIGLTIETISTSCTPICLTPEFPSNQDA